MVDTELPPPSTEDLDVNLLEFLQTLTPLQRLLLNEGARELALALQEAGRTLRGSTLPAALELEHIRATKRS